MEKITANFEIPATMLEAKARLMHKRTTVMALAVGFVASFVSMVVSSYCANHIHKSTCGKTDIDAHRAYKLSTYAAVLSALVSVATFGGMIYVLTRKI